MADPWLTIIGVGEDGRAGLSLQSQAALDAAEVVMGPPRHLALLAPITGTQIEWPVPFAGGFAALDTVRGQRVVVLASGDPFWFGAGVALAERFDASEWRAMPGPSSFSLAAAELGWPLQSTVCLGLHAAPFAQMRSILAQGVRLIATLRDGDAVTAFCAYLTEQGFGPSRVVVLERLGGPTMRRTDARAESIEGSFDHPLVIAVEVDGAGPALTSASGQDDNVFEHDGQITKRPVRAITLSTLAPKPGEHLWDVGAGSGSIALEWLLSHPTTRATAIEAHPDRAARVTRNAKALGVAGRLTVVEGRAPEAFAGLKAADAIFVGGGLEGPLLEDLLATPARLVINAVTLESEALLVAAQTTHGGDLLRIDLSHATPLGPKRGWKATYPVVQWSLKR